MAYSHRKRHCVITYSNVELLLKAPPGREFTTLVKALYEGRCQVCGEQIADPAGARLAVQVHHLERWDGDRSDRLDNAMVVCPNDYARFELGLYVWTTDGLRAWDGQEWELKALALDKHLTVKLAAS